ncbi:hypothetical protein BD309DRAFT_975064 [Dichomitus squalens]|nr:hypothetical protein BD309DRAFT_975064 [Dichomitus squalens]
MQVQSTLLRLSNGSAVARGSGHKSSHPEATKPRKTACEYCHSIHKRCIGRLPCARCVARGIWEDCTPHRRRKHIPALLFPVQGIFPPKSELAQSENSLLAFSSEVFPTNMLGEVVADRSNNILPTHPLSLTTPSPTALPSHGIPDTQLGATGQWQFPYGSEASQTPPDSIYIHSGLAIDRGSHPVYADHGRLELTATSPYPELMPDAMSWRMPYAQF